MNELALCAGIGGFPLGLSATARTVCYVEREAYCVAVLVARMEAGDLDVAPVWSDLTTFDGHPWRGAVDIITAGFPCQPFSSAGKRRGMQDKRWLWPTIARIIDEVRPSWVFLENSPRIIKAALYGLARDLDELGYDCAWDIFSAAASGAPHIRKVLPGCPRPRPRPINLPLR